MSSFNSKKTVDVYMIYNGGVQTDISNYSQQVSLPMIYAGATKLAWFKIPNDNDGFITLAEFIIAFERTDVTNDAANTLDDDSEGFSMVSGLTYQLEKRSIF